MPEEKNGMDLEKRRRLLEERRQMLQRRRQELGQHRKDDATPEKKPPAAPPPKKVESKPPERAVPPKAGETSKGKPAEKHRTPPGKFAATASTKKTPTPPPAGAKTKGAKVSKGKPVPPKPGPKKSPEKPAISRPDVSKTTTPKAAPPKRRSPLPMILGLVAVVAIVVILVIVFSGGGEDQAAGRAQAEGAVADSVAEARTARAREDSLRAVEGEEFQANLNSLKEKINEAKEAKAGTRAKSDFDQAQSLYDQAVQLQREGDFDKAMGHVRSGTEKIEQALARSLRVQEREDASRRSEDDALANLRSTVATLRESLTVLSSEGANEYALKKYQQLSQIIDKAGELVGVRDVSEARVQADWAFEMVAAVRAEIADGKEQEIVAKKMLVDMKKRAVEDSVRAARAESASIIIQSTGAKIEKYVSPVYPPMAEQAGIEGRVVVEFEIGIDGKARDFVIIEKLPAGCEDAAIEAIKRMEFAPATQGGKPVATRIKMPFMFKRG